jgi:hypothetical protein
MCTPRKPHEHVGDRARHVARDREADALVAARAREDRGVDADQLAAQVDERAAGVAGVDRRVGLDEVLVLGDVESAAGRRHDAHRHRLADAERVADREDDLAEPQLARVAERQRAQRGQRALELEDGEVRLGIGTDDLRLVIGAVVERDGDGVGALDDVRVGEDAAAGRDDDARAHALRHPRIAVAEAEAGAERIGEEGIERRGAAVDRLGRRDVDDAVHDALGDVGDVGGAGEHRERGRRGGRSDLRLRDEEPDGGGDQRRGAAGHERVLELDGSEHGDGASEMRRL